MKNIFFFIIILCGTHVSHLKAQVIAMGHISAEIVEANTIIYNPDLKMNTNSFDTEIFFSDSTQTFNIGELKFDQGGGTVYDFTVKPFKITNATGKKIDINPYLESSFLKSPDSEKKFKLKGKIKSNSSMVGNFKGYFRIIQNFN